MRRLSGNDNELSNVAFGMLDGKMLEQVEIQFPSGDTVLHFSGRLLLRLMPIHAERLWLQINHPRPRDLKIQEYQIILSPTRK